jgi:hypothetical protein
MGGGTFLRQQKTSSSSSSAASVYMALRWGTEKQITTRDSKFDVFGEVGNIKEEF